jgi:hypothetical protein
MPAPFPLRVSVAARAAGLAAAVGVIAGESACADRERTFDGERAFRHLEAQVAAGPRIPGTEGYERTAAYVRRHLESTADRLSLHRFREISPLDSTSLTLTNFVAVFTEESSSRILFGAHWDTRPIAEREEEESRRSLPVPGANDGASGVAVLLEIAAILAERPPRVGVDLVLFDGEDQGVEGQPETYALGSAAFVRDHPDYRPTFVVILDMVGRKGARFPREAHSVLGAAPLVETVWRLGRERGIGVLVDSLGAPVYDDHVPFLRAGIPAIDVIDFADPDWHTTRDLPDNCSPETLEEIGRLVLALIERAEETLSS